MLSCINSPSRHDTMFLTTMVRHNAAGKGSVSNEIRTNGNSSQATKHRSLAAATELKVVTFEDWAPARPLSDSESDESLENHLSRNLHGRGQRAVVGQQRLTELPGILKRGQSALIH